MRNSIISNWTYLLVCPVTCLVLSDNQNMYSSGICPHCGNNNNSTITHRTKVVCRILTEQKTIFSKKVRTFLEKR